MQRLAWKNDLIAKVEARLEETAQAVPPENAWAGINFETDEYRRVTATGRLRHDLEVQIYALTDKSPEGQGGPGYWVITPLERADGSVILINRGFVPPDRQNPATRVSGLTEGEVAVTGLLRTREQPSMFSPPNEPSGDSWFVRDPEAIAAAKGLKRVAPFFIDADATPNNGGLPIGGMTRIAFPNRHFEYALTWYGLAATLVGVYIAFVVGRLRQRSSASTDLASRQPDH